MGTVICVASGKGGAGKSTLAAGISYALQREGHSVLLADTDCGLCSVEFLMEQAEHGVYHGGDVLGGTVSLDQAILAVPGYPHFLPAPPQADGYADAGALAALLMQAAAVYEFVIVDRPAGLDTALERALPACMGLVVSQPDRISLRGASMACAALTAAGCDPCGVVLNRFVPGAVKRRQVPTVDELCDQVGARLLGIVPEDPQVAGFCADGVPQPKAPYQKAMARIAGRLCGRSIPLPKLSKLCK